MRINKHVFFFIFTFYAAEVCAGTLCDNFRFGQINWVVSLPVSGGLCENTFSVTSAPSPDDFSYISPITVPQDASGGMNYELHLPLQHLLFADVGADPIKIFSLLTGLPDQPPEAIDEILNMHLTRSNESPDQYVLHLDWRSQKNRFAPAPRSDFSLEFDVTVDAEIKIFLFRTVQGAQAMASVTVALSGQNGTENYFIDSPFVYDAAQRPVDIKLGIVAYNGLLQLGDQIVINTPVSSARNQAAEVSPIHALRSQTP